MERAGVKTVAQLAVLQADTRIPDLNPQVFERLRAQAALQECKRRTGENKLELIESEPGRGFSRLPKPNVGDLFFDMEGDPLHPEGLEYLFGLCLSKDGQLEFKAFWAHDHDEERTAFAEFMGFIQEHLTAHPGAYIYHYNHYETTSLMGAHGRGHHAMLVEQAPYFEGIVVQKHCAISGVAGQTGFSFWRQQLVSSSRSDSARTSHPGQCQD